MFPRVEHFRPSPLDHPLYIRDRHDWRVVALVTQGEGEPSWLSLEDRASRLRQHEGATHSVEVHRIRHWGFGYFWILIVNPYTEWGDAYLCDLAARRSASRESE